MSVVDPALALATHRQLMLEGANLELQTAYVAALVFAGFPPDLTRPPFPHEVTSRTTFAGIEDDVNAAAGRLAAAALRLRADVLDLIAVQITARAQLGPAAVLAYLDDLAASRTALPGVYDATEAVRAELRVELDALAQRAAARALTDAAAAGAPRVDPNQATINADVAGEQARRLAADAADSALRAVRGAAYATRRVGVDPVEYVRSTMAGARQVGTKGLEDVAGQAALAGNGAGRGAAWEVLAPADPAGYLYASELLDRATCPPCSLVDGKRYATREEADADYPTGRYVGCRGGDRCRGTLVFVHEEETGPTLQRFLPTSRSTAGRPRAAGPARAGA